MNRAERRRLAKQGIKVKKEPVINIKQSDVEQMKIDTAEQAAEMAFFMMLAIPTMVIHDHFGDLMKREGREQNFIKWCLNTYECFGQGLVTLEDLEQCLYQEAGLRMDNLKLFKGGQ